MSKFRLSFRCDQRWEGMRPVAAGKRHCDSCDKTVVDVSRMTETEVAKAYKLSGGSLCVQGWFENRDGALMLKPMPEKKRLSVLQPATLAAAMALAACNEPPRTRNDQTSDASGMDADADTDAGAGTDRGADLWSKAVDVSNGTTSGITSTPSVQRGEVAAVSSAAAKTDAQSQTAIALRTWLADTAEAARSAVESVTSAERPRRFMGRMARVLSPAERLGGAITAEPEFRTGELMPPDHDAPPPPPNPKHDDSDLF